MAVNALSWVYDPPSYLDPHSRKAHKDTYKGVCTFSFSLSFSLPTPKKKLQKKSVHNITEKAATLKDKCLNTDVGSSCSQMYELERWRLHFSVVQRLRAHTQALVEDLNLDLYIHVRELTITWDSNSCGIWCLWPPGTLCTHVWMHTHVHIHTHVHYTQANTQADNQKIKIEKQAKHSIVGKHY